ncbi:MAG TPA: phage terminase large subunit family protein, partial [Deltaproteobacteria bacterium]|nr:phage terminase large subunit family protein [Deltaproteobacteria bacterium]
MLSPEASAEHGKWYTARAEYQRGIMDAFSDPTIETVVVMSSAQIGKTEILNNVIGY